MKTIATLLALGAVLAVGCGSDGGDAAGGSSSAASNLPSSPLISRIRDAGKIKVGMATTMPWLGQDPKTKDYFGPAATLARELAKRLGVEVEFVPVNWDTFIAALQAQQVDVVGAPLNATPERKEVVTMVNWSSDGLCYFAKKTSTLSTLDDLKKPGVKFAAIAGSAGVEIVKKQYPDGKVVSRQGAPGETFMYPELRSGAADVAPSDAALIKLGLSKHPDLKVIPADCPKTFDAPTSVAIALPKGDDGMQQVVEEVVKANKAQLDAELEKYSAPSYLEKYS